MLSTELKNFSQEIKSYYESGKIRTPIHLSGGNEEQLIQVFKDIRYNDWVFSTYRSHYHALLKGIPADQLKRMILHGNSMHINSWEHRFFTSSIVGGCMPIALGVAMANKRLELDDKVWVFIGDMAAEMGITHEVINYAIRHKLQDYFTVVIEDNSLSVNTPTQDVWCGMSQYPSIVKYYKYERTFPHSGTGVWVNFLEDKR